MTSARTTASGLMFGVGLAEHGLDQVVGQRALGRPLRPRWRCGRSRCCRLVALPGCSRWYLTTRPWVPLNAFVAAGPAG
jgi:hypothetical protein